MFIHGYILNSISALTHHVHITHTRGLSMMASPFSLLPSPLFLLSSFPYSSFPIPCRPCRPSPSPIPYTPMHHSFPCFALSLPTIINLFTSLILQVRQRIYSHGWPATQDRNGSLDDLLRAIPEVLKTTHSMR